MENIFSLERQPSLFAFLVPNAICEHMNLCTPNREGTYLILGFPAVVSEATKGRGGILWHLSLPCRWMPTCHRSSLAGESCQCVGIVPHISGEVGVRSGDVNSDIDYDYYYGYYCCPERKVECPPVTQLLYTPRFPVRELKTGPGKGQKPCRGCFLVTYNITSSP